MVPVSVFVSRKSSKLFVRQGFSPLFDVAVKIENPEEPLGTHVFAAMELQSEGAAIRWTVVSIPEGISSHIRRVGPRNSEKCPRSKPPDRYRRRIKPTLPSTASKYPRIRLRGSRNY